MARLSFSFVLISTFNYCDARLYSHYIPLDLAPAMSEKVPFLNSLPRSFTLDKYVLKSTLFSLRPLFFGRTLSLPRFLLFCFHLLRYYPRPSRNWSPSTNSRQPQLEKISFLKSYKYSL